MQREIIFRGQRTDTKEWVYGTAMVWNGLAQIFVHHHRVNSIWAVDTHQVIPETVGQFTGLFDKNGKKIFEGDKLLHNGRVYIVKYSENQFCLLLKEEGSKTNWRSLDWCNNVGKYIEIIDSIHSNPELLTKQQ